MSQEPPPPLDHVPVTALRKRKTNRNNSQQTNSEPSNNQNPTQPNPKAQQTSGTDNSEQDQASSSQVITDLSTLGPLKKRRSKPKTAATTTTEAPHENPQKTTTEPLPNVNENKVNFSQQSSQSSQAPQGEVIAEISSLGPLKQRKSRSKPTFVDIPSDNSQTGSNQTPIETNEIPNIEIKTDSSYENISVSSSGSRLGLDIEQDNALSARYMNPNFDLSKIGKNESKQILSKSISQEYGERFTKDMTAKEEQFRKEYVKPMKKDEEQLVNASFIKSELNSMIESVTKNIQSNTEKFDLNKCNFNGITKSDNLFTLNISGLAKSYTITSQEAVDSLSGKYNILSIEEIKKELDADFLKTSNDLIETNEDFIKQIRTLISQVNKQASPTEFVIDLSNQESIDLICKIAFFFTAGLKCHSLDLFNKLYSQMNEDSCGRANIVSLQTSLLQAKSTITDITGSFRYAVFYVLHLIQLAQCSSLLRYMSELLSFKKKNYYIDALINDSDLCNLLSEEVEKIECSQIQGDLVRINIQDGVPAVSGDRFALRVTGIVESYLRKVRNWLLQGVENNSENSEALSDVLMIFVKTFLTQKNGSCLSIDALYDIFEGIAGLSEQNPSQSNLDPCCSHPAYKKFMEIYRGREVTKFWDTKSRIWTAIVLALNEKILPYIVLFGVSIPQTKAAMNPAYFRDPNTCLRIAHAFLPMNFPSFNIRFEMIKHYVS